MPTDDLTEPEATTGKRPVRINVPTWMSAVSVVVGVVFFGLAVFARDAFPSQADFRLTLCIGFGLVLSGLGTQASGSWRSWSVAGGGAAAMALYLLLFYTAPDKPPAEPQDPAKIARIEGGFDETTTVVQVEADDNEHLFTTWGRVGHSLRVRIEPKHMERGCLGFVFFVTSSENETVDDLVTYVHAQRFQLQEADILYYDSKENTLFSDQEHSEAVSFEHCMFSEAPRERSFATVSPELMELIVGTAQAAEKEIKTDALLRGLKSDNALVRREARQLLGAKGLEAIRPTMDELARSPDAYRVQIGAVSALAELLNAETDPAEVRARLRDEDIARLAPLVANSSFAMRRAATAAMEPLADPRAVDSWTYILATSESLQGRYNAAFILNRTYESYDAATQERIRQAVAPVYGQQGPQTQALLDPVLAPPAEIASGWLHAGISYGKGWEEKPITWPDEDKRPLQAGDIVTTTESVGLHEDQLRYVKGTGWVDPPEIAKLEKGRKLRVTEVNVVAGGVYWAKVEPVE
jgi:hypothetical protein